MTSLYIGAPTIWETEKAKETEKKEEIKMYNIITNDIKTSKSSY